MPTLTTLAKLKTHLGITDTAEDALLTQLLGEVDQTVLDYLQRGAFVTAAATEYYSGSDRPSLVLRRRPVTAVAGVWVDGAGYGGHGPEAFPDSSEWEQGVHWFPMSLEQTEQNAGMLIAIGGVWPCGQQNIKVTNTAGYATVPVSVELAVHQLCAAVKAGVARGGIISQEQIGRYSYSIVTGGAGGRTGSSGLELATARAVLARYKEVSV